MDLLADLNEPQRQAVTHVAGPLLVLAGAGSGKTRVITRRVGYLISQGIAPWSILAITFTNKAAGEMAQRVAAMNVPRGAMVATFHSLCARLLREYALEAGLESNYTIYDTADQTRLAKRAMELGDVSTSAFTPGRLLSGISKAKMQLKTPGDVEAEAGSFRDRQLARGYKAYQQALNKANALDFDDLLMKMALLLRHRPDVRQHLGQRFQYVLIDEYQDTNHAQYIIAHTIAHEHHNICATGDPDQSIYTWRGADISNILEFETDYPDATVIRLEENYRSTAPILAAASSLIACNRQRKAKNLFTRREGGAEVAVMRTADEHAEAGEIVSRIRKLVDEGLGHGDIAVFYRLNSLSRVIEDALRRGGVPYRIARGTEFYNRKEVKDVLGYLKLLVNPADDVACERVINTPARGIGATTVKRLRKWADRNGLSLYDAVERAEEVDALGKAATRRVSEFASLIGVLRGLLDAAVKDVVEAVIDKTGLEADLRAHGGEDEAELANIFELVSTAAEFDQNNQGATLLDYLNQVALVSDLDHFEGGNGAVTLMTLHAAKGLEFPAVFLLGLEDGLLPFRRADGQAADVEEERRLCFVGMTRAQQHLTISYADYRSLRGARNRQAPSEFLAEIGQEHICREDLVGHEPITEAHSDWFEPPPHRQREMIERRADDDDWFDGEDAAVEAELADHAAQATGGLAAGMRVHHNMFGHGRVAKVQKVGPYTRVVVEFDKFGRKTLIREYAKLEIVR